MGLILHWCQTAQLPGCCHTGLTSQWCWTLLILGLSQMKLKLQERKDTDRQKWRVLSSHFSRTANRPRVKRHFHLCVTFRRRQSVSGEGIYTRLSGHRHSLGFHTGLFGDREGGGASGADAAGASLQQLLHIVQLRPCKTTDTAQAHKTCYWAQMPVNVISVILGHRCLLKMYLIDISSKMLREWKYKNCSLTIWGEPLNWKVIEWLTVQTCGLNNGSYRLYSAGGAAEIRSLATVLLIFAANSDWWAVGATTHLLLNFSHVNKHSTNLSRPRISSQCKISTLSNCTRVTNWNFMDVQYCTCGKWRRRNLLSQRDLLTLEQLFESKMSWKNVALTWPCYKKP